MEQLGGAGGGPTTASTDVMTSGPATFVARVSTFEALHRVLQVAGDGKLRELQELIQCRRGWLRACCCW